LTWRSLAERLSRGIVLHRRLPDRFGGAVLYVTPDASLRFWRRRIEKAVPDLLAMCDELVAPGQCVWDIGANVGVFAVGAAHLAGRSGNVVAVEPDPWLARLLERSAAGISDSAARVEVVQAAVAEREGRGELVIARRGRATNHLESVHGSTQTGGRRGTVSVPIVTVDGLLVERRRPDLLKVDAEGSEHLCLAGATQVLRAVRPTVLCEVATGNRAGVGRLFADLEYVMLDASDPAPLRRPLPEPPWNTLAQPRERWQP